jgi:hypothetical protein
MSPGATTPEELEAMLEDAFVLRDRHGLGVLFEDGAVLASQSVRREARGVEEIARLVSEAWERGGTYVADPRRIVQARETALVVAGHQIAVVRRGADRGWRYAISLLTTDGT